MNHSVYKNSKSKLSLLTEWRRVDEQRHNSTYSEFWNQIELFTVLEATAVQIPGKESPVPTECKDDKTQAYMDALARNKFPTSAWIQTTIPRTSNP